MRWLFSVLVAGGALAAPSLAQDHDSAAAQAKAKAALALAQARREAQSPHKSAAAQALARCMHDRQLGACMEDLAAAQHKAQKEQRKLFVWVGMTCIENPAVRSEFPDAVHVHVNSFNGSATPRLLVGPSSGTALQGTLEAIPKGELTPERVKKALQIRRKSAAPASVMPAAC